MHIGHLSTTLIGECIKKVHNYLGYKTVAINYVGDYGTPFGKIIAGYELWGSKEDVDKVLSELKDHDYIVKSPGLIKLNFLKIKSIWNI